MDAVLTTLEAANIIDHMHIHLKNYGNISNFLEKGISVSSLNRLHRQGSQSISNRTSNLLKVGYGRFLKEYDITERDSKEYKQQLNGTFNGLDIGSTYEIEFQDSKNIKRSEVTIVGNYPNFYLVKTDKGVVTTILKNDLYTSKYKIKKSHNGGAVAGSTN